MKYLGKRIFSIMCVIVVLIFLTIKTEAQSVELGLRYNPEFSGLINSNDYNAGKELGLKSHFSYFSFGGGAVFNFNKHLGLAVDILFSREGQAFSGNISGGAFDPTTYSSVVTTQMILNNSMTMGDYVALAELNYIKLPIMLSITTNNTKPFFLTLLLGPQINFLQGVAQELNNEDQDYPNSNIESKDLYKALTINGVVALGGAYNISSHLVLSARVRVDYGFEDVEKKDIMISYNNTTPVRFYSRDRQATHNITVGLLLGLDFKL